MATGGKFCRPRASLAEAVALAAKERGDAAAAASDIMLNEKKLLDSRGGAPRQVSLDPRRRRAGALQQAGKTMRPRG